MARKLTLKEIDAEIARLQKQASDIRDAERSDVIGRMKEAIVYYQITAADLGLATAGKSIRQSVIAKAPKGAKKLRAGTGGVKFKDDAGNTWSGFGPKPRWFRDALTSGKTAQDLRA